MIFLSDLRAAEDRQMFDQVAWIRRYSACHIASSTCCTMSSEFDAGQSLGNRCFRHG